MAGVVERDRLKPATVHQELRVLRRMLNVAVRKKLLPANPCAGVEFPVTVKGLFRPHYMTWSEQQTDRVPRRRSTCATSIRIITETGLRVYKELMPMRKEQVDLDNAVVWIPDSKTPNGIAEVPLTELARRGVSRSDSRSPGPGDVVVPERREPDGASEDVQDGLACNAAAGPGVPYFRIYDLRSTYATRLERGRRGGRVGHAAAPPGGREGVQEVLADEAADETGGAAEAEPEGQRGPDRVLSRRRSTDGVLSRFCHGRSRFGSIWADGTVSEIEKVV